MIQLQSNAALDLQLAYENSFVSYAGISDEFGSGIEFLDSFLPTVRSNPVDNVRDGWFKMPDASPATAIYAIPVRNAVGASNRLVMRITVYQRFKKIHKTANAQSNLVADWSYTGDVVFQGYLNTLCSTAVPDLTAAGAAANFYRGSGLWTMQHGSTTNSIVQTSSITRFPAPAIVPVNAGDIIRAQVWNWDWEDIGADGTLVNVILGAF